MILRGHAVDAMPTTDLNPQMVERFPARITARIILQEPNNY